MFSFQQLFNRSKAYIVILSFRFLALSYRLQIIMQRRYEAKVALENARDGIDRKRTTCSPERLPINWMRYTGANRCITEWCQELSAATGTEITLDKNAVLRLEKMPYENTHTYLRRLTEAIMARDVICPSAYLIGFLRTDEYRADYHGRSTDALGSCQKVSMLQTAILTRSNVLRSTEERLQMLTAKQMKSLAKELKT